MTPWESETHIPQDSSVTMSCNGEKNQALEWTITLPGHRVPFQFGFQAQVKKLHKHNFYKLKAMGNTVQLLINSTEGNNGTKIECVDVGSALTINETILIVDGEYTLDYIMELTHVLTKIMILIELVSVNLTLEAIDVDLQLINISWSQLHLNKSYTLTVTSLNTQPQLHESLGPYFLFTAPEGAPPCEVYNFSVAATYVGTTYTGPGCHVVLSRMLPSLPNKEGLESSFNYSIEREGVNAISITVSVKVRR